MEDKTLIIYMCIYWGVTILGWVISAILFIIKWRKAKKEDRIKMLQDLVTPVLIPLMEQAEKVFETGEERETWVINKLGQRLHIDFFKYDKVLQFVKNMINEICKQTKINVNKEIVIEEKKEEQFENKVKDYE